MASRYDLTKEKYIGKGVRDLRGDTSQRNSLRNSVLIEPEMTVSTISPQLDAERPSKFWSGFMLKKLPMCGASEDSADARVYFEWPTIADFKRMAESLPAHTLDQKIFKINRIESTAHSVV